MIDELGDFIADTMFTVGGTAQFEGPYYRDDDVTVYQGDCLKVLRLLASNSVDAVCTDPPYSLSFMGRGWDTHATPAEYQSWCQSWATECLRVLKPGGHLLAFGGTRTAHRLACAIEDAGFEIRDSIAWLYGSGFPKSLDVSKAIDRSAGAERDVIGRYESPEGTTGLNSRDDEYGFGIGDMSKRIITAPATDAAKTWAGWGTALKPSHEPIIVARKPIQGTVAANVLAWGTGALNIDATRVKTSDTLARPFNDANNDVYGKYQRFGNPDEPAGRWPPNVVLDGDTADMLDKQSGTLQSGTRRAGEYGLMGYMGAGAAPMPAVNGDSGGASRFFPTFRYQQQCVLYGMLTECEHAVGVATKSPLASQDPHSAACHAQVTPPHKNEARLASSPSNASIAATLSTATPETIRNTVLSDAAMKTAASTDLHALFAESLCASCATAIAQSLVATQRGHLVSLALGLPSTNDFSEQILTRSLAHIAADLAKLDTTSTTTELMTLLGCVVDAISAYTTRAFQLGTKKSEDSGPVLPRFKYSAKAPGHERPSTDGVNHPTVKPVDLMRWLVKLVTPPGGTVLDPFAGSGTTGEACIHEHKHAILIEREPTYLPLIVARLHKPMHIGFDFDEELF